MMKAYWKGTVIDGTGALSWFRANTAAEAERIAHMKVGGGDTERQRGCIVVRNGAKIAIVSRDVEVVVSGKRISETAVIM